MRWRRWLLLVRRGDRRGSLRRILRRRRRRIVWGWRCFMLWSHVHRGERRRLLCTVLRLRWWRWSMVRHRRWLLLLRWSNGWRFLRRILRLRQWRRSQRRRSLLWRWWWFLHRSYVHRCIRRRLLCRVIRLARLYRLLWLCIGKRWKLLRRALWLRRLWKNSYSLRLIWRLYKVPLLAWWRRLRSYIWSRRLWREGGPLPRLRWLLHVRRGNRWGSLRRILRLRGSLLRWRWRLLLVRRSNGWRSLCRVVRLRRRRRVKTSSTALNYSCK